MLRHCPILVASFAAIFLAGCVPDEESGPSSALFPVTQYGETRPDFTLQLASRAPREDAELFALYGAHFASKPSEELNPVRESLAQGAFVNEESGKKIQRIRTLSEAREILQGSWDEELWAKKSDLAEKFKETPNASVAYLGTDDQRILFFDASNHLIDVYPEKINF